MTKGLWLTALLALACPPAAAEEIAARLEWARRVELSVAVSGMVAEVLAEAGDRVAKGSPLLRLDPRRFEARTVAAQARLERRRRTRGEARRELDRAEELYDRTLLARHDLELAQIGLADAQADFRAAQAELAQAELDLEYSVVRAPFDSILVQRRVEPGQTVAARLQAPVLAVLAEWGKMLAVAQVSARQSAALQYGQAVAVMVDGAHYAGNIRRIGLEPSSTDEGKALYRLAVEFAVEFAVDRGRRLRAGQPAALEIP